MESDKSLTPIVVPAEVQELSRQIEQWRSTRQHRGPMPEQLWALAASLAKQCGVARVARFLHLDYYSLKERVESADRESKPTFIELPLATASAPECTLELEHARGRRMRIHLKGAAMSDVTALSRTLWGMKS